MLAQREEARRVEREGRRGEEKKCSRRELEVLRRDEGLSQSMNRGPKLSIAPQRILPRTDLR